MSGNDDIIDITKPTETTESTTRNPWKKGKPPKKYLKLGVYGKPGTGKTRFAMTFPEPIYIVDTELGSDALLSKFPNKNINTLRLFKPNSADEKMERDDADCYIEFRDAINYLYDHPEEIKDGTIVIDSMSDIYDFVQSYAKVVHFKVKPEDRIKYQFDWGVINNHYQQVVTKLLFMPCNVVFCVRPKEIYAGAQGTGVYEPKWRRGTEHLVDVMLQSYCLVNKSGPTYGMEIEKCRLAGSLRGKKIDNLDFTTLKQLLLEEMKKEREKIQNNGGI